MNQEYFEILRTDYGKYKQTIDLLTERKYLVSNYADNRLFYMKNNSFDFFEEHFRAEINEPLPRVHELYTQIENLKVEFMYKDNNNILQMKRIYNNPRFIQWKSEVIYEIQKLSETEYTKTLITTLNSFNGFSDEKLLNTSISMLKVISTNYEDFTITNPEKDIKKMGKTKKIFISHSTKDKEYVSLLVNLLEFIGLGTDSIICTSIPGFGIPLGASIYDFLRDNFNNCELHVIFAHSRNFYNSPICLNEMGATWVAKSKHTSILLPNFNYNEMVGVVDNKNLSIKLDSDFTEVQYHLDELYNMLICDFNLTPKLSTRWEQKRNEFIEDILKITISPIND